jgi:TrmH family RNA methyltransferase
MITSSQNAKIKRVRALAAQRKERQQQQAFVAEGVRAVEDALAAGIAPTLMLTSQQLSLRGRQMADAFQALGTEIEEITPTLMSELADTETPQGVLAVFDIPRLPLPNRPDFILIADLLRDPGNLGTLMRTASAAGVQALILTPGTTDAFAPKVVRSGMGAHFRLPVYAMNWEEIHQRFKLTSELPFQFLLAEAGGGRPAWELDLRRPLGLVIGGEAEGASADAHAHIDEKITIPMPGKAESLNAAVAAGILLFEVVRQRRFA